MKGGFTMRTITLSPELQNIYDVEATGDKENDLGLLLALEVAEMAKEFLKDSFCLHTVMAAYMATVDVCIEAGFERFDCAVLLPDPGGKSAVIRIPELGSDRYGFLTLFKGEPQLN